MLISDVMRRLNTEHEIEFLLTAYVETLQFYDAGKRLPPGVTTLPLKGMDDIESRFADLLGAGLCGLAGPHCTKQGAIASEATEVFSAAFARVQALRRCAHAPAELPETAVCSRKVI